MFGRQESSTEISAISVAPVMTTFFAAKALYECAGQRHKDKSADTDAQKQTTEYIRFKLQACFDHRNHRCSGGNGEAGQEKGDTRCIDFFAADGNIL